VKFNTVRFHPFEDYVRFAIDQAKLGVVCRFLAPDGSWEVTTQSRGGELEGVLIVFDGVNAAQTARQQCMKLGEIITGFQPHRRMDTYFTIKLPA